MKILRNKNKSFLKNQLVVHKLLLLNRIHNKKIFKIIIKIEFKNLKTAKDSTSRDNSVLMADKYNLLQMKKN